MTAQVIQMPDRQRDSVLLGCAWRLRVQLKQAVDELDEALLAEDAEVVARAGRKLASLGWMFRDAADRRDRGYW